MLMFQKVQREIPLFISHHLWAVSTLHIMATYCVVCHITQKCTYPLPTKHDLHCEVYAVFLFTCDFHRNGANGWYAGARFRRRCAQDGISMINLFPVKWFHSEIFVGKSMYKTYQFFHLNQSASSVSTCKKIVMTGSTFLLFLISLQAI